MTRSIKTQRGWIGPPCCAADRFADALRARTSTTGRACPGGLSATGSCDDVGLCKGRELTAQ